MRNTSILPTIYAIGFFAFASNSLLYPVMPLYADKMGASVSEVGLIVALLPYSMALSLMFFGSLSDRFGRRIFFITGLIVTAVTSFLYILTTNPVQLALLRIFNGFGFAAIIPSNFATVIDLSQPGQHGKAIGWYTTATQFGLGVGPVIGGYILSSFNFEATFLAAGILSLAGLAIVLSRSSTIPQRYNKVATAGRSWAWLKQKILYGALLTTFTIAFGGGTLSAFIPLYSETSGISAAGAGLIITLSFISSAMLRVVAGTASDKVGRKPLILGGLALSAITIALISILHSLALLSIVAFCFGIGMGIIQPSTMALAADVSPEESRGLVISTIPTAFQMGYAIGPTTMGIIAGISNLETMFLTCGLSMAFALIIIIILFRTRRKSGAT